jgi:hypothetical protein
MDDNESFPDEDYPFYDGDYSNDESEKSDDDSIGGKIFYGLTIAVVAIGFIIAICGKIPLW